MLETAHAIALSHERRVEDVELEDGFGHDAADTYAGILQRLIDEAGGFGAIDAPRLTLLEEQARQLAAKRHQKEQPRE